MARISRRVGVAKVRKPCLFALYARISVDDGSDSIENQLGLLRGFVVEHRLEVFGEYVDIGVTGTNFKRHGFGRMIKDIESGFIGGVVVKDLSRLGRNYLETGELVEKIWPMKGVRFIAVVDGYDSNDDRVSDIMFNYTIKNLVNEMYAYDISQKVKSSIAIKKASGKTYRTSIIPYGYKLKIENEGMLSYGHKLKKEEDDSFPYIIDDNVWWVVEKIFNMSYEGITLEGIVDWLYVNCINTPSEYRRSTLVTSRSAKMWSKSTVSRMLKNNIYRKNHFNSIIIKYKCNEENI